MIEQLLRWVDWRSSGRLVFLSILVGLIAGVGAIVFQWLNDSVVHFTLAEFAGYTPRNPAGEHTPYPAAIGPPVPWAMIAVMAVGGLLSGAIVYTFAPEAEGHGTDAAIDAFHNRRGMIRARIPIVKTIASAITIGTGGSGGREGPIAQIGAGFGSYLATILKLPARDRRILLAAGVGAGVGAIFRAPLAGALFAAEILYSDADLEADVIIPAATASIISYSVYCLSLPETVRFMPLFGSDLGQLRFENPLQLLPYGVLSVILVVVGVAYIKVFYGAHALFKQLPIPRMLRPALGAALAGIIGVALFHGWRRDPRAFAVLGTGYGTLQEALGSASSVGIPLLLTIAVVKIITTALTIGSGGSGGVFGPSMVIGGCVGSAFGLMCHSLWPEIAPAPEAFAIVAMAGFFAGCAHAPFSTIIMVSEMTGGYGLLLPAMWCSTLCFVMGRPWKLYSKQVSSRLESPAHRGDFLVDVLEGMTVQDVFDPQQSVTTVPEGTPLSRIVRILSETGQHYFPVVDADQRMVGIFSETDVRGYLFDETIWKLAVARDVMTSKIVSITPTDDLNTALRRFTATEIDELPVVDPQDRTRLLGMLRHKELIVAYNRRLAEHQQATQEQA